jgi:serine/threonine protein phosphatase PrpC
MPPRTGRGSGSDAGSGDAARAATITVGPGWAVLQDQGGRQYNEDRYMQGASQGVDFFGVFDGHNGSAVADACARNFASSLIANVGCATDMDGPGAETRLRRAFQAVDDAARSSVPQADVGSTACVLVLTMTDMWVANAGDTRAVLKTRSRTVDLSTDHKPDRPDELRRIQAAGGFLTRGSDGCYRIMGGLNLSRALGDWSTRPMVVPTPDVTHRRRRTGGDEYIVIASDGVWDVLPSAAVTDIIDRQPHTRRGVTTALQSVLRAARARGSTDNVTILYVGLLGRKARPA